MADLNGDGDGETNHAAEEAEPMETAEPVERTEDYQKLIDYGIDPAPAGELDKIYQTGLLSHGDLDERALDALKEFPAEGGIAVLKQFSESNLEHVTNKSAYLCGVMKTYRQRMNKAPDQQAQAKPKGPDEAKLKDILDRTGYSLDVTTGQRKYGGPPPDWDHPQPGAGHEVFAGKIPKDIFEDELIPLFEKCGKIWDLRLMMDPMTGLNRGYAFVTFCDKEGAHEGVKQLDNYEIRKGKTLKVNISVANLRLFVGNIPKSKSKEEIMEEFEKMTDGLQDVIIYSSPDDNKKKNRGFAFLEYDTHKSASLAKRRIGSGRTRVWGCDIIVDWADPQEEPDYDTMSKVKVLYVRNLKADISEEQLRGKFEPFGKIERVKKIKDYGFIHFEEREHALEAMKALNNTVASSDSAEDKKLGETEMEISLAKPPTDNKKKEQRRQQQQTRMMMMGGRGGYGGYDDYWGPPGRGGMRPPPPGRGGRMRGPPGGFGKDYYDDYYSYNDYRGGYADPYYDDFYGYDDYDYGYGGGYGHSPRGRGRGGPPPPGGRGRGNPPRGARGAGGPRGARGAGRGLPGGRGGRGGRGAANSGAEEKIEKITKNENEQLNIPF